MTMSNKNKVYEEVLNEIQQYIKHNELSPGDRLPSERELSEQLHAGRSSIREALRSLELIGLIETRRGEGTFLRSYQIYRTVELLSAFILQDPDTRQDLGLAKSVIEKEATKLAFASLKDENLLKQLEEIVIDKQRDSRQMHIDFFMLIFQQCGNHLLKKIWQLMEDFSHHISENPYDVEFYFKLLEIIKNNQYIEIELLFNKVSL